MTRLLERPASYVCGDCGRSPERTKLALTPDSWEEYTCSCGAKWHVRLALVKHAEAMLEPVDAAVPVMRHLGGQG